ENKKQRLAVSDGVAQPLRDSPCERGDAFIRGRSLPAESERNFVLAFRQVEGSEVVLNGARKLVRIYFAGQAVGRLEDLQVFARQQRSRIGNIKRVAAQLHAVFRRAERRGAYAFAGRQERPGQRALLYLRAQRGAEQPAEIAEIALLAPVDELGDAAREHHAVDAVHVERRGQIKVLHRRRRLTDDRDQGVGHPVGDARERRRIDGIADAPGVSGAARQIASGRIEPHDAVFRVHHQQASADVHGRRRAHLTVFDDREFRGAAADIYIKEARAAIVRRARGARAV